MSCIYLKVYVTIYQCWIVTKDISYICVMPLARYLTFSPYYVTTVSWRKKISYFFWIFSSYFRLKQSISCIPCEAFFRLFFYIFFWYSEILHLNEICIYMRDMEWVTVFVVFFLVINVRSLCECEKSYVICVSVYSQWYILCKTIFCSLG